MLPQMAKGPVVLIADEFMVEQLAFLEICQRYLPASSAHAVGLSELEGQLAGPIAYDVVIIEARFVLEKSDQWYIQRIRERYPGAKIVLFLERERLHEPQIIAQLPAIDMFLTKCLTVETIAEALRHACGDFS